MTLFIQWIDLIWLGLVLVIVHKDQRALAVGFVVASMVMMRLMSELMVEIGYARGLFELVDMSVFVRGQILYSLNYVIYMGIAYFSPDSKGVMFMAASMSIFFATAFIFAFVMVL